MERIRAAGRVGKLTDEIPNGPGSPRRGRSQAPDIEEEFRSVLGAGDLARLLRKQSGERSHTMIAATAFAVVGLVVVAFLNRIP